MAARNIAEQVVAEATESWTKHEAAALVVDPRYIFPAGIETPQMVLAYAVELEPRVYPSKVVDIS